MNIPQEHRFYRLEQNNTGSRWVGGVCLGLADSFKLEAWVIRLVWLFSILYFGVGLLAYAFAWLCIPMKDQANQMPKKLLLGVCTQIAINHRIEVGLVRFITLSLSMASFGFVALAYVIAAFVMPKDSQILNAK